MIASYVIVSSGNQPRRNEEDEEKKNLRSLRFFVVDFHCFWAPPHGMGDSSEIVVSYELPSVN
jgi:hypothetical protein